MRISLPHFVISNKFFFIKSVLTRQVDLELNRVRLKNHMKIDLLNSNDVINLQFRQNWFDLFFQILTFKKKLKLRYFKLTCVNLANTYLVPCTRSRVMTFTFLSFLDRLLLELELCPKSKKSHVISLSLSLYFSLINSHL